MAHKGVQSTRLMIIALHNLRTSTLTLTHSHSIMTLKSRLLPHRVPCRDLVVCGVTIWIFPIYLARPSFSKREYTKNLPLGFAVGITDSVLVVWEGIQIVC